MNVTLSVETAGQRADQFLAARLDGTAKIGRASCRERV